ncbi:serine/threonine-protein kinase [Nonomuraea sp. NEAU-A123]|uniref:serine/threonine protein kinase n=1 Tax=Nonomuraea sp. NEAU-A123 TaxID=2839649 RepID=UPI001BE3E9AF|nr:serine/threonine-protein kinase [Nonomuraea sp. NEAU-A123]MBT2234961.1 protein kinase [Nonomuraea sp. NEAU-A123]
MPEFAALREEDPIHVGEYRLIGRLSPDVFVGFVGGANPEDAPEPPSGAAELVVVKLLDPEVDQERFLRMIEPFQEVSAFCTAQVLGSGLLDDRPYVVSEYIDGPTLEQATAAGTRLRNSALHRLAVGTATALVAIHQANVVHGDIRPGNVVLGPDGPRLINFGIGRAMAGTASATTRKVDVPAFTAPERLGGAPAEPPADLFSWAATLVAAASGRSPFDGGSMAGTVNRITNGEPDLPDLGDLRELVLACLAKDPALRPTSSDVLLRLVGETNFLTARLPPPSGLPYSLPPPRLPPDSQPPLSPDSPPRSLSPSVGQDSAGVAATVPVRRGRGVLIAVVAFLAGALVSGVGVYTLPRQPIVVASGPSAPRPSGAVRSEAGTSVPTSVITAAPLITPSVTSAPVASVAPKADKDVKLADIDAILHENSADPVRLAAYLQVKRPFKAFARDRTGQFKEVGLAEEPRVSPMGDWVALNPWVKFQTSDMDHVRFTNLNTKESFTVNTVKKPAQTWSPAWSRDGGRLLLSIMNAKRDRITGFVVVDVRARTATVVKTQYSDASSLPFAFTPDGKIARGYNSIKSHGIETYDMSGKVTHSMHWVGRPRDVSWYSPSGKQFMTVCPTGKEVCIWDATTGDRKATVPDIKDDSYLLGWFDEDHILVQESAKKGRAQVEIVDFLGKVERVLVDLAPNNSARQFGPKAP